MRVQYSILPPLFPVSQPFISRFSLHAVHVYQSTGNAASTDGYDALKSSALPSFGASSFPPDFLSRPFLRHQQDHAPRQLQHPPTPPRETQGE